MFPLDTLGLVPWLEPDQPAPPHGAVHGHVFGRSCGLGGERGRAAAQHPAHDDLARFLLVPVRAALLKAMRNDLRLEIAIEDTDTVSALDEQAQPRISPRETPPLPEGS